MIDDMASFLPTSCWRLFAQDVSTGPADGLY